MADERYDVPKPPPVTPNQCPTCGNRAANHNSELCLEVAQSGDRAVAAGSHYDIPEVATSDLWAHFNTYVGHWQAERLVNAVMDLGWRPVVGSIPGRLWQPAL